MRTIKFRAWDKQTNSWFQNGDGFALSWDATAIIDDMDEVYYTRDRIVFQQFTGLKDKNGKEIYEGDIVNGGQFNGSIAHGKIVFWTGGWWIEPLPNIEGMCDLYNNLIYLEVIGNIYENPELLTSEQTKEQ